MSKVEDKTLEELKKEMDAANAAYTAEINAWAAAWTAARKAVKATAHAASDAYYTKLKEARDE